MKPSRLGFEILIFATHLPLYWMNFAPWYSFAKCSLHLSGSVIFEIASNFGRLISPSSVSLSFGTFCLVQCSECLAGGNGPGLLGSYSQSTSKSWKNN